MKTSQLFLISIFLVISACRKDGADKFEGTWRKVGDESNQVTILKSGKNFIMEVNNEDFSGKRLTASYNKEQDKLEMNTAIGSSIDFIYDKQTDHLLAAGEEFERVAPTTSKNEDDVQKENENTVTPPSDEATGTEKDQCNSGKFVVINGSNVRLRSEPDVTKQNILLQLDKGTKVTYIREKNVGDQLWYNVCHNSQIGWVSGQFASLLQSTTGTGNSVANTEDAFEGVWTSKDSPFVEIKRLSDEFRVRVAHAKNASTGTEFRAELKNNKLKAIGNASDFYKFELPTFELLPSGKLRYSCGTGPYELSKSNVQMPKARYTAPENND